MSEGVGFEKLAGDPVPCSLCNFCVIVNVYEVFRETHCVEDRKSVV